MRILITNDDSITSPILPGLIRWAKTKGDVTVVVPKVEQSGKSQAIEFYHAVEVKEVNLASDLKVWAMNSTPADCVRFGVLGLHQTYENIKTRVRFIEPDIPESRDSPETSESASVSARQADTAGITIELTASSIRFICTSSDELASAAPIVFPPDK